MGKRNILGIFSYFLVFGFWEVSGRRVEVWVLVLVLWVIGKLLFFIFRVFICEMEFFLVR